MKKLIFALLILLLISSVLYLSFSFVVSRLAKWEIKGHLSRTTTKEKIPLSIVKMHMSEGIKYIPDKTHNQLTEEDSVYNYYVYEQDSQGKTIKNKCYNIGPDNTRITTEQYLKDYLAYEYNNERKLIKEICYNDKGPDNKWFTADDLESYHSVYEYDNGNKLKVVRYAKDGTVLQYTTFETNPQGLITIDVIYKGKGADSQWFTADDGIEKYHRFYYDDKGFLIRIAEYHSERNGQGPDGVWLTADDVISATKVISYSNEGYLTKIKKCIGPGPDNVWFSDDDPVQYYTVYESVNHRDRKLK